MLQETTAAPAATETGGSYMTELIGGSTEVTHEPEVETAEAEPDTEPDATEAETEGEETPEAEPEAATTARAERIKALAAELGLDANDPAHRKTLVRLAAAEKRIADSQTEIQRLRSSETESAEDWQTDLERELYGKKPPEKPADKKETVAAEAAPATRAGAPVFVDESGQPDIGHKSNWRTWPDAYRDRSEAYEKGDVDRVIQTEAAMFRRQAHEIVMPQVERMIEDRFRDLKQTELGEVLPVMKNAVAERREQSYLSLAASEIRKNSKLDAVIQEMLKPEEGDPVNLNGETVPRNALNRLLAENPWVQDIVKKHQDQHTAGVLTFIERYRVLAGIYQKEKARDTAKSGALKNAVKAGVEMTKRSQTAQARARINQGAAKGGTAAAGGSYVLSLKDAGTLGDSVSSLRSRRQ